MLSGGELVYLAQLSGTRFSGTPWRPVSRFLLILRQGLEPVLVALAYYVGAVSAFVIGTLSDHIFAPFWPPNVILFVALLRSPPRRWPAFILAAFPAHVAAESLVGMPPTQMLTAFATNCLVAVLNAVAVRRLVGRSNWFASVRGVLRYLIIAVVAVPAACALVGAFVQISGGGPHEDYWEFWSNWFVGNALGFITLGPAFLIWLEPGALSSLFRKSRRIIEAEAMAAGLIGSCVISAAISAYLSGQGWLPPILYLYVPLPFKLWAAVRFGRRGAGAAVLVVAVVSIWAAVNGSGLFLTDSYQHPVLPLQIFLALDATVFLLLGASIDQLRATEGENRRISHQLLRAADEERRRIARELHDNTAQQLFSATMMVEKLANGRAENVEAGFGELGDLLRRATREVRTLSYLLHPPLLDEGGLRLATENYVDGFVKRSGISVDLDFPSELVTLSKETELALFRVVQETLANILRHSNAPGARIALSQERVSADCVSLVLTVEDFGRGIDGLRGQVVLDASSRAPFATGVGLRSLAERLAQVGGHLEVASRSGLTTVRAVVTVMGRH
jgi:signal transduction histidine kinase